MILLVTNALAGQGRGQGGRPAGVGAPSHAGKSSDHRGLNSGKTGSRGKSAAHSVDPKDTHGFKNYGQYVAATHVAENLEIDFDTLKTEMVDHELSLGEAIAELRPELSDETVEAEVKSAEAAAKKAEAEAKKRKPTE
jgi:hypothetical protein